MKFKAIVCAVAVGLCFGVRATDYTLVAGENELTAEMNAKGNRVIAVAGSVLKLTGAASGGVYTISCAITAQAGELVIDATGVTDLSSLRMTANVGSDGKGSVTIKGVDKLTYGTAANPDRRYNASYGDVATIDTDLAFVNGAGEAYTSPSVTFVNGVLIKRKPNYAYAISDGAYVFPFAASALADVETASSLVLDTWDLGLIQVGGVTDGTTIKVGSERTLFFKPCNSTPPEYKWGGDSDKAFVCDIELASGARFLAGQRASNTIKGKVSGSGAIEIAYSDGQTFDGDLTEFTGPITLNWHEQVAGRNYLRFKMGAGLGEGASITATSSTPSTIDCQPAGLTFALRDVTASVRDDPNVTIQVKAGKTAQIGTLTGSVRLAGGGCVDFERLADNAKVVVSGGTKAIIRSKARSAQVVFEEGPDGNRNWMLAGPSDGEACGIAVQKPDDDLPFALTLGGKLDVQNDLQDGCTELSIEKNAVVSLPVDPSEAVKVRNYGGTLTVQGPEATWRGKVSLWVDATEASSITFAKDFTFISGDRASKFDGKEDLVGAWKDCRNLSNGGLAQIRFTTASDKNFATTLYPKYHAAGGPNDKPYMENWDIGKSRFYMVDPSTWTGKTLATRHVLMVFGSQNGGGKAVIAETHGHYVRSGGTANDTLVSGSSEFEYVVATNGVTGVDPRVTKPTGGWQILSLAVKDTVSDIVALGGMTSASDGSNNGGQCYAEVLLFDVAPSEAELASAEQYLSAKWGLPVQRRSYEDQPVQVTLQADVGTYAFGSDANLSGSFKGTLNLNGKRVSIPSGSLPYTEAEIPAEGRALWVDPSFEGAVVFGGDEAKPLQVWGALPRDNAGLVNTNEASVTYLLGVADPEGTNRRPWLDQTARVPGAASGWLDFGYSKYYDGYGKVLMLAPTPINPATIKLDGGRGFSVITTLRDGFLVLDSSKGGGSTYLSQANGNNETLRKRAALANVSDPIWSSGCGDAVLQGETRLDGVEVDQTAGFTGKPEVLSFFTTDNVTAKTLGYYNQDAKHYEMFAETILYTTPLTDEQRRGIESYLMHKWLGKMPAGYTDFRGATVTGAGTLVAPSPKYLPQFDAGFTGALEFGGFDGPFVLNGGTAATNLQDFGDRNVTLSSAVTIDITVVKRRAGSYKLVAGTFDPAQTSLSLGTVSGFDSKRVSLRVEADGIYADIDSIGMLMFVQ